MCGFRGQGVQKIVARVREHASVHVGAGIQILVVPMGAQVRVVADPVSEPSLDAEGEIVFRQVRARVAMAVAPQSDGRRSPVPPGV